MENGPVDSSDAFEKAIEDSKHEKYILRLYISGSSPKSTRAVSNVREICEQFLQGRYELEVIDIYQQPELARSEQIIAAPTLVKKLPMPLRRMIGDLTRKERIRVGLDLLNGEK